MNRRRVSWLLVVLVSCAGFAAAAAVQEPNGVRYDRLVITGGMLMDGLGGTVLVPTFVIYEPNRDLTRAQNLPWYRDYALPVMLEGVAVRNTTPSPQGQITLACGVKKNRRFRRLI